MVAKKQSRPSRKKKADAPKNNRPIRDFEQKARPAAANLASERLRRSRRHSENQMEAKPDHVSRSSRSEIEVNVRETVAERLKHLLGEQDPRFDEEPSRNALQLAHPFPAPLSPTLTETILTHATTREHKVLDPMAGSGTVVLTAHKLGRVAHGLDIDPLARLMMRVASRHYDAKKLKARSETVLAHARADIKHPRELGRLFKNRFDKETQQFIRYWFPLRTRRRILALWTAIEQVRPKRIQDALALAFSRTIIAKTSGTSLAIDLPHTRPHRKLDKKVADPLEVFPRRLQELLQRLPNGTCGTPVSRLAVRSGDARRLPFDSGSFDLVLTSSPYANAIDYIRAHKFSLVWMGYSVSTLATIRSQMIGAERGEQDIKPGFEWLEDHLPKASNRYRRRRAILRRYFYDLDRVLSEMKRVLKPGGACVLVLGRSTVGKCVVDTPAIVVRLARANNFEHIGTRFRRINPLRRSLPFPSARRWANGLGKRMAEEAVIGLAKH
jgi:DNA modification methylase